MRFRQFEFRLFPKIKSRKRKKTTGQICGYDFSRDKGLDNNSNYSDTNSSSCYDDMAVQSCNFSHNPTYDIYQNGDNIIYNNSGNYANCCFDSRRNNLMSASYDSYMISELKVNVECSCECTECSNLSVDSCNKQYQHYSQGYSASNSPRLQHGASLTSSSTASGSLPRIRTRIKTNPWLPSPKSTPTQSPTDSLLFNKKSERVDETAEGHHSCPPMPAGNPWSFLPCSRSSFPGLVQIAKVNTSPIPKTQYVVQQQLECCSTKLKPKHKLNLYIQNSHNIDQSTKLINNPNTEPARDTFNDIPTGEEFFQKEFEMGAENEDRYEDSVDELLESADFPRDDTFESLKGAADNSTENAKTEGNDTGNHIHVVSENCNNMSSSCEDVAAEFDINNADTEAKDTVMVNPIFNETVESDKVRNMSRTILNYFGSKRDCMSESNLAASPTHNMQDSIDTGYASASREFDSESLSSTDGVANNTSYHASDLELEWDNDPVTETLTIDAVNTERLVGETKMSLPAYNNSLTEIKSENCMSDMKMSISAYNSPIKTVNKENYMSDRKMSRSAYNSPMRQNLQHDSLDESPTMTQSLCEDKILKRNKTSSDFTSMIENDFTVKKRESFASSYNRRSRSLADIQLSLEEKVTMLREEKTYVQRKIQESINEEKIRRRQNKILAVLTKPERKDVLLKTLHDLKTRLEDQSERLQSSYSTVLTLRKRFSQRRRTVSVFETDL